MFRNSQFYRYKCPVRLHSPDSRLSERAWFSRRIDWHAKRMTDRRICQNEISHVTWSVGHTPFHKQTHSSCCVPRLKVRPSLRWTFHGEWDSTVHGRRGHCSEKSVPSDGALQWGKHQSTTAKSWSIIDCCSPGVNISPSIRKISHEIKPSGDIDAGEVVAVSNQSSKIRTCLWQLSSTSSLTKLNAMLVCVSQLT